MQKMEKIIMSLVEQENQKLSYKDQALFGTTESAKQIYFIIASNNNIQAKDIIKKVEYSSRTVRYSLRVLLNLGLIKQIPNLEDCRSHFYQILL